MVDVEKALSIVDNFTRYKDVKSILIKGDDTIRTKVSICIPTYKRVDTLRDTVESCLAQVGYDDYVIIVSDNNPSRYDETEQYISTLQSNKIIYYKHEANIGMFGNINRLFELSLSEFTVCVHDDDILFPHFLSITMNIMKNNHHIDILFPNSVWWYSEIEDKPQERLHRVSYLYRNSVYDCAITNPHPPTGFIARTKSIKNIGGFDIDSYPSNDYYFNVKSYEKLSVYTLHEQLYIYRWGVNTTLKLDTILSFIKADLPLKRLIVEKCNFLKPFKRQIDIIYSDYKIKTLKENYPSFNLDELTMLITKKSTIDKVMTSQFKFWYSKINSIKHILTAKWLINKF